MNTSKFTRAQKALYASLHDIPSADLKKGLECIEDKKANDQTAFFMEDLTIRAILGVKASEYIEVAKLTLQERGDLDVESAAGNNRTETATKQDLAKQN